LRKDLINKPEMFYYGKRNEDLGVPLPLMAAVLHRVFWSSWQSLKRSCKLIGISSGNGVQCAAKRMDGGRISTPLELKGLEIFVSRNPGL
jgi:hypothetical protein